MCCCLVGTVVLEDSTCVRAANRRIIQLSRDCVKGQLNHSRPWRSGRHKRRWCRTTSQIHVGMMYCNVDTGVLEDSTCVRAANRRIIQLSRYCVRGQLDHPRLWLAGRQKRRWCTTSHMYVWNDVLFPWFYGYIRRFTCVRAANKRIIQLSRGCVNGQLDHSRPWRSTPLLRQRGPQTSQGLNPT